MSARAGDPGQPGTTGGAPFMAGQTILPGKPFVAPFAPAPAAAASAPTSAPTPAPTPTPAPAPAPVASSPEPVAAPQAPASAPASTEELPPLVTQLAPPPILPPSEIDQAEPKGRRQVDPKLLLLVLLVVVAAAAAYWFFLKPSSSSDETFVPPVHHKAPAAATQRTVSTLPASFAGFAQAPATTAAGKAWHVAAAPFTKAGYRTVVGGIYTHASTPEFGYVAAASPRAAAQTGSLAAAAFAASVKQTNPKATFVEKPVAAGPLGGTAVCGSATGLPLGYCTWRDGDTAGAVFGIAKDLPRLLLQVRAAVEH